MGVVTDIEDVTETIENAIEAIYKIEKMQPTHYNWSSIATADRLLFLAEEQLRTAQKTLNEAISCRVDAYFIDRTLAALMNDVDGCDWILDQASNSKESDRFVSALAIWWQKRFLFEMEAAVEAAALNYLNSYSADKEERDNDELEDLMRLHS